MKLTQLFSALFVDFDNVASELIHEGSATATRFSSQPGRWLEAIRTALPLYVDSENDTRSIVARRCYASPHRIGKNRQDFTRAGFEVIDCPPLTAHLKNSADIYMVMDILDYVLRHPRIGEFIILSADADFTPILTRLRRELKRTVIFSATNTASAYKNCSDQQIAPAFFSDALNVTTAVARPRDAAIEAPSTPEVVSRNPRFPAIDPQLAESVEQTLHEMASRRNGLAHFAAAASYLRNRFMEMLGADWGGYKAFAKFLKAVPLTKVRVDWDREVITIPNFVPDLSSWPQEDREALAEFVADVLQLYSVPLLAPAEYTTILSLLAEYWSGEGGTVVDAIKVVLTRAAERDIEVAQPELRFVVTAILQHAGTLGPETTIAEMAEAVRIHVFQACDEPEWMLERDEAQRLVYWIRAEDEGEAAVDEFLKQVSDAEDAGQAESA